MRLGAAVVNPQVLVGKWSATCRQCRSQNRISDTKSRSQAGAPEWYGCSDQRGNGEKAAGPSEEQAGAGKMWSY